MKIRAMSKEEDRKAWIRARLKNGQTVEQLSVGYEIVAPRNFRSRFDEWIEQEKSSLHFQSAQNDQNLNTGDDSRVHYQREMDGNRWWDSGPEQQYIDKIDRGIDITEEIDEQ